MISFFWKIRSYLCAMLMVGGALFGAFHLGVKTTRAHWEARWNERDAQAFAAQAFNEAAERALEQSHRRKMERVIKIGQIRLEKAAASAAAAHLESRRLRTAADGLAARIETRQARRNSRASGSSEAATSARMVLTDLLKRVDRRAGSLAQEADASRSRGMTCEQAFKGALSDAPEIQAPVPKAALSRKNG